MKPILKLAAGAVAVGCFSTAWADSAPDLNQWVQQLPGQGYTVSQGGVYTLTSCDLFIQVFGNCSGNNPSTPYVIPQPPVGGEYVDPIYGTPFTTIYNGTPVNNFYRLADTEALVTVVDLPPQAAYLGYQTYVFTRDLGQYPLKGKHPLNASPDPQRLGVVASVGNDVNNAVVTAQLGSVWSAGQVVYITTANQALADALKASATAAGGTNRVFVEPLGSNVYPGLDAGADDFLTLLRYALPEDSLTGPAWLGSVADHVQVYRVSNAAVVLTRYGTPAYTPKQDADELADYHAAVAELTSLLKGWLKAEQHTAISFPLIPSVYTTHGGTPHGTVGVECLARGTSCAGDDQDTDSYRTGLIGTLGSGRSAFIAGVDHTALHYASYISLSFYDLTDLSGFASVVQTDGSATGFDYGTLRGSAAATLQYLGLYQRASPALVEKLPQLYVAMVSRQCPAGQSWCLQLDASQIAYDKPIAVIHRAYLKPGTTTGASPDRMVTPQLIR